MWYVSSSGALRDSFPSPGSGYEIVYADPPWAYFGSKLKNAAAGKHYDLMSFEELAELPVRSTCAKSAVLFMWATCPKLHVAVDLLRAWGFHYRGVPWIWIKTARNGNPLGPRGVPPTLTKPVVELIIAGTTSRVGRPFKLVNAATERQVVLAPVGRHSAKPEVFRQRIEALCGDRPRLEMFARGGVAGWDAWGAEAGVPVPPVPVEDRSTLLST